MADNSWTIEIDKFYQGFSPLAFSNSLTETGGGGSAATMQNVVRVTCIDCKKERGVTKRSFRRIKSGDRCNRCRSCADIIRPRKGGRAIGYKHTEETKRKISEIKKGHEVSEETIEKLRRSHIGMKPNSGSFKKGENKGDKCHLWKGGITPLSQQIRHCFEYKQWRAVVFERDDYTCQKCEARNGNGKAVVLNADHHPKLFSEIFQEYNIQSLEDAVDCEEFWNINNGRTLCAPCHKEYGRTR